MLPLIESSTHQFFWPSAFAPLAPLPLQSALEAQLAEQKPAVVVDVFKHDPSMQGAVELHGSPMPPPFQPLGMHTCAIDVCKQRIVLSTHATVLQS